MIHSIMEILSEIAEKAPEASIYIAGYLRMFGSSVSNFAYNPGAPGGGHCGSAYINISFDDAQWINLQADRLNAVISDAVSQAYQEGLNVTFVSAEGFDGHGLCDSSTQWINQLVIDGFSLQPLKESFHPTIIGWREGYGYAFLNNMN